MRVAVRLLMVCAPVLLSVAGDAFDGNWSTKLTCPAKGDTEGYTWQFASVVQNNNLRGEHGTAGEPGYLVIEGKIAADGGAKLTANGIGGSRKYARGVLTHKDEECSYSFRAQFEETQGTGTKSEGLGIIGRACSFDFVKQAPSSEVHSPITAPPHTRTAGETDRRAESGSFPSS
jgi:hypothetical protein